MVITWLLAFLIMLKVKWIEKLQIQISKTCRPYLFDLVLVNVGQVLLLLLDDVVVDGRDVLVALLLEDVLLDLDQLHLLQSLCVCDGLGGKQNCELWNYFLFAKTWHWQQIQNCMGMAAGYRAGHMQLFEI